MQFSLEKVEQALAVCRDAQAGRSFHDRLDGIGESLRRLVPSTSMMGVIVPGPDGAPCPPDYLLNLNVPVMEQYARYYHALDPTIGALVARPGVARLSSEFIPDRVFGSTEYTRDCLARTNARYIVGAYFPLPSGRGLVFSLHREPGRPDYSAEELALARLVFPDVARAVQGVVASFDLARLGRAGPGGELRGVLLLGELGEVLHADAGGLGLARALAPERGTPGDVLRAGVDRVRGNGGSLGVVEQHVPLGPPRAGWARLTYARRRDGGREVTCLVEVVTPGTDEHFELGVRRAGLTPREAEVARLAIRGLGNKEIAAELGISGETVKVHLGRVYGKTGVSGRAELAARLLGARPPGGP